MEAAKWEIMGYENYFYNTAVIDGERHWLDVNGNLFTVEGRSSIPEYKFATRKAAQKVLDEYLNKEKKMEIVVKESNVDLLLHQCEAGTYVSQFDNMRGEKCIFIVYYPMDCDDDVCGPKHFIEVNTGKAYVMEKIHNALVKPCKISLVEVEKI